MTKSDIFGLVFKIIGLYFFVLVFTNLMQFFQILFNYGPTDWGGDFWAIAIIVGMLFGIIMYFIFGYFFIFKTNSFLKLLKIYPDEKVLKIGINKTDIIEVSLVIISVIAMVFPLSFVLSNITEIVYFAETDEFGQSSASFDQNSISMVIRIAIGIFLLFNSRNFEKWIVKKGEGDDQIDKGSEMS